MLDPLPERAQVLIHFYRAVVAHADSWRQRMDATTNWAAATSAVMITFALGNADAPHFVMMIALAFDLVFLLMESRRYQTYDLWRRRFRMLNRHLIVPSLLGTPEQAGPEVAPATAENGRDVDAAGLRALAADLSSTVPHLGLASAVAYRVRRNYGYLLIVVIGAWGLKLEMHPAPAASLADLLERARIGAVAGAFVVGAVALLSLALLVLALAGPTERMRGWTELPSPIVRLRSIRIPGRAPEAPPRRRAPRPKLEAME